MKTAIYPFAHSTNPYVGLVKKAIECNGYEVVAAKDVLKSPSLAKEIKVVTLNWFDAVPNYPLPKLLLYLLKMILRIYYFKLHGIKIIHTFHNAQEHDTKHPKLSTFMMRFMCKHADRIAVLCDYSKVVLKQYLSEDEIEKKVRVVYHPTYEGIYPEQHVSIPELKSSSDTMHVLFVGAVRPYKNIEMILKVAKEYSKCQVEFTIAGKPISKEYADKIKELSREAGNVNLILRFIEDEEVTSLYHWADIIFLPLSAKSSLNSGSAMLAVSLKRTLVATQIGTLMDFPKEYLFTYGYTNEEEHYEAALKAFEDAYNTWYNDHSSLQQLGQKAYEYANSHFSLMDVSKRYQAIYAELEKQS